MRYLDVCAGISAPTVGWRHLGWECAAYSEIESAPRAVLAHHYPDTPLHGDFTTIKGDEYGPIDLLVGGTPCQSFSVAGLRKGMDDDRGNLSLEYLRLAHRARPRWLAWENVPGVLSIDGGRAFGAILGGMAQLGYGWAYRILDAQYFGVPQRRRRVFVVGYLGDWRRAAAVLFERHSLSGHPPPRREAEESAPTVTGKSFTGRSAETRGSLISSTGNVPHCLNAGGMGRQDYETETLIAHSLRGEGFDASEDGTGRGTPIIPVPFDTTQITSAANYSNPQAGDPCHPLAAGAHPPAIAFDPRQADVIVHKDGAVPLDASFPGPAIRFSAKDHGADAMEDLSPMLRAGGHSGSHANAGVMPAIAYGISSDAIDRSGEGDGSAGQRAGLGIVTDASPTIRARGRDSVATASAVRRLTPVECERLQGFPDSYTAAPYRKGMMADGPRYKMLGNSMAVPVIRWIGERIAMVDAL